MYQYVPATVGVQLIVPLLAPLFVAGGFVTWLPTPVVLVVLIKKGWLPIIFKLKLRVSPVLHVITGSSALAWLVELSDPVNT